jgi:hypothetical protein
MRPEKIQKMRDILDFAKTFEVPLGYDLFVLVSALEEHEITNGIYLAYKRQVGVPYDENPNFSSTLISLAEIKKLVAIYG